MVDRKYYRTKDKTAIKEAREINIIRVAAGMPKLVAKFRNCLSCDIEFYSEGPQVRKCGRCRTHKEVM